MQRRVPVFVLALFQLGCGRADFSGSGNSASNGAGSAEAQAAGPGGDVDEQRKAAGTQEMGADAKACPLSDQSSFLNFEGSPYNVANSQLKGDEFWNSHGVRFRAIDTLGQPTGKLVIRQTTRLGEVEPSESDEVWLCIHCPGSPSRNRLMDAAEETRVGRFLLSTTDVSANSQQSVDFQYRFPVVKLSFDLVDVDGGETWKVTPLDGKHVPIAAATQVIQATGYGKDSFTGKARRIEISSSSPIYFLEIEGAKDVSHFGFAFDNFKTGVNPECLVK